MSKLFQIHEADLETLEEGIENLKRYTFQMPTSELVQMMGEVIKHVRDDYGPHTNVEIIE